MFVGSNQYLWLWFFEQAGGACRFGPDVSDCVVEQRKISDTTKWIQKSLEEAILLSFDNNKKVFV